MGANSKKIRMTISVPNDEYMKFHSKSYPIPHNRIINQLISKYNAGEVALDFKVAPPPIKRKA